MCLNFRYHSLPEFPTALEPREVTRWDMHKFTREAYELGVRYIGGCCGIEPHHIRAISEELQAERGGRVSEGSKKHERWNVGLKTRYENTVFQFLTERFVITCSQFMRIGKQP